MVASTVFRLSDGKLKNHKRTQLLTKDQRCTGAAAIQIPPDGQFFYNTK
jgi:6-phosphogluconolactonase (cycloisomerase 2 family)